MYCRSPLIVHQNAVLHDVQRTSLCAIEYHTLICNCLSVHTALNGKAAVNFGSALELAIFGSNAACLSTHCAIMEAICLIGSGASIMP